MKTLSKNLSIILSTVLLPSAVASAQTCNSALPETAAIVNFEDHGNGTITDNYTGLMWQRCAVGLTGTSCATGSIQEMSWDTALQYVDTINTSGGYAGYSDWRLPNIKELGTIVEYRCSNPAINTTIFPNTPSLWFWTLSPDVVNANNSLIISFTDGSNRNEYRPTMHPVRLVRSGK